MSHKQHAQFLPTPNWSVFLAVLVTGGVCAVLLNGQPFLGHDWVIGYYTGDFNIQYPPWMPLTIHPLTLLRPRLGLASVQGIAIAAAGIISYRLARESFPETRQPAILALGFALVNPILWMLVWLGQIEGLVLASLLILPISVPILALKPNIALWAVLGTRRDLIVTMGLGAVSLVFYGLWPLELLNNTLVMRMIHPAIMGWRYTHPLIGVLGAAMLLVSDRSPWRLMAAGVLTMPFIMPYHFYFLLPALGCVRGYRQLALWIATFPLIGATAIYTLEMKLVGLSFPILVWLLLAPTLRPREVLADPDILLNRALTTLKQARAWVAARIGQPLF